MRLKRNALLLAFSILMFSSIFAHAEGNVYIKGSESTKTVGSEKVYIQSGETKKEKTLSGLTVSGSDKTTTIGNSTSNGNTNETIEGVVTTVEGLNVRVGPSTSYTILGSLSYKTVVTIVETSSGWHKIEYKGSYGYVSASYVSTNGALPSEPEAPSTPTNIKKIVIDPGHGGSDPGAVGPNGLREKDSVLDISLKLRDILQKNGYVVEMTRTTDVYLSLPQRVAISNSSGANFFLSVHNNSFSATSHGTETYSYQSTGFASNVARKIQSDLVGAIGLTNRGFKTESFYVLKYNNVPSALVEVAFISNPYEESLLANESFRLKSAQSIAESIMSFK